jgi:type I restriction enzyme M protein
MLGSAYFLSAQDTMTQKIEVAWLAHAETIWKTADTLRGAGIKEGDWPSYMMPFFALMRPATRNGCPPNEMLD